MYIKKQIELLLCNLSYRMEVLLECLTEEGMEITQKKSSVISELFLINIEICNGLHPNFLGEFMSRRKWKHPWGVFPKGRLVKQHNKRDLEQISKSLLINIGIGNDLSSREATLRVLSAREVFTTVFGMGTGGFLLLSHR